ncbi:MAG: hypothetical protein R2708_05110 [Vicinamibacterales bacterium]
MLTAGVWLIDRVVAGVPWSAVDAATHPSARPAFAVANLATVLLLTLALSVVSAPLRTLPRLLRILSGETLSIYIVHLLVLFGGSLQLARRIGPTLDLPRALGLSLMMIAATSAIALGWHRVKQWRRTAEP